MEPIKIAVHVSPAVAIRSGSPLAGESLVPLSTEVLSALTDAERETLARILGSNGRLAHPREQSAEVLTLPSADTSAEAVRDALRERIAAYETERAVYVEQLAARADAEPVTHNGDLSFSAECLSKIAPNHPAVSRALAAMAAMRAELRRAWLAGEGYRHTTRGVLDRPRWAAGGDAEVDAAIEQSRVEQRALEAEEERREAERKAAKEAAEAKAKARKAAVVDALRAYALTVDELRPAAEDGYDVTRGAVDHIAAQIHDLVSRKSVVSETVTVARGSAEWDELDEVDRKSPRAAYVLAQRELAKEVAALTLPDGVKATVHPVQLVTRTEEDEYREKTVTKRTALFVILEVECHAIDRAIYGYCE